MELVEKKEIAARILDLDNKTFVVYVFFLASSNLNIDIYLFYRAQIASFIVDKTPTTILFEYTNFADVFFPDFAVKFPK